MEKTATLNLRVNPTVKERAEKVLSQLGVPMSTAIDMYLNQISLTGDSGKLRITFFHQKKRFHFLFLYQKHQYRFMQMP